MWRTSCKISSRVDIGERTSERVKTCNDPRIEWCCSECSNKIAKAWQGSERNCGAQRAEIRCDWKRFVGGDHHACPCCRHQAEQEWRREWCIGGEDQHACLIWKCRKVATSQKITERRRWAFTRSLIGHALCGSGELRFAEHDHAANGGGECLVRSICNSDSGKFWSTAKLRKRRRDHRLQLTGGES
jgi:hypothetical protein